MPKLIGPVAEFVLKTAFGQGQIRKRFKNRKQNVQERKGVECPINSEKPLDR